MKKKFVKIYSFLQYTNNILINLILQYISITKLS